MLRPKTRGKENLKKNIDLIFKTIDYLNSQDFREMFMYSGRFKIGHRQLSKSLIDIKVIN